MQFIFATPIKVCIRWLPVTQFAIPHRDSDLQGHLFMLFLIFSQLLQQNHASLHCIILKCVVFPFILEHYSIEKQFKHALKHKPIFCFLFPVELLKSFDLFPTRSFYLQYPRFLIFTSIHNVAINKRVVTQYSHLWSGIILAVICTSSFLAHSILLNRV